MNRCNQESTGTNQVHAASNSAEGAAKANVGRNVCATEVHGDTLTSRQQYSHWHRPREMAPGVATATHTPNSPYGSTRNQISATVVTFSARLRRAMVLCLPMPRM